jgi:hypothetical protein
LGDFQNNAECDEANGDFNGLRPPPGSRVGQKPKINENAEVQSKIGLRV